MLIPIFKKVVSLINNNNNVNNILFFQNHPHNYLYNNLTILLLVLFPRISSTRETKFNVM